MKISVDFDSIKENSKAKTHNKVLCRSIYFKIFDHLFIFSIFSTLGSGSNTISERRMAKYKEERKRQLASQIANRLSTNQSASSSDENEDSGSSSLEKYAKYRR